MKIIEYDDSGEEIKCPFCNLEMIPEMNFSDCKHLILCFLNNDFDDVVYDKNNVLVKWNPDKWKSESEFLEYMFDDSYECIVSSDHRTLEVSYIFKKN